MSLKFESDHGGSIHLHNDGWYIFFITAPPDAHDAPWAKISSHAFEVNVKYYAILRDGVVYLTSNTTNLKYTEIKLSGKIITIDIRRYNTSGLF